MNKDSVTISLLTYHRLINAEKRSQDDANKTIEDRANREIEKLKKSSILMHKSSYRGRPCSIVSILTDSEAVEKIGEKLLKLQSTIDEKVEDAEKEGIQYKRAYNKLKNIKWYNLLFGIEELKL